jgi:hypothetical protein
MRTIISPPPRWLPRPTDDQHIPRTLTALGAPATSSGGTNCGVHRLRAVPSDRYQWGSAVRACPI